MIQIVAFSKEFEQQVIDLIVSIQNGEFGVDINADDQPDLKNIKQYYQKGNGNFWLALSDTDNTVLGTISLLDIGNQQVALRKMFVAKQYRGAPHNIGQKLMDEAITWCKQKSIHGITLGTVPNYHAAHRFYEKNAFQRVNKHTLPQSFPIMDVDKLFYHLYLV